MIISHEKGYPTAYNGKRHYPITFDTLNTRGIIEPQLETLKHLPDGYEFRITEGLEKFVAKVVRIEATVTLRSLKKGDRFKAKYKERGYEFELLSDPAPNKKTVQVKNLTKTKMGNTSKPLTMEVVKLDPIETQEELLNAFQTIQVMHGWEATLEEFTLTRKK